MLFLMVGLLQMAMLKAQKFIHLRLAEECSSPSFML